ncbi:mucin-5AC isoform X2 [Sander lucioperca]|uniref:mucin-5AC isoform X2 n=1 Tax=Sander lucioperca TaxID=283035 RepID=UPI001653ABE5|nr:mucin-5AC isoform X2 [Sander lucioperca]
MVSVPSICAGRGGGSSWAPHEPAALTLRAGTSRQQPAGRSPSSSRTGEPAWSALNISNTFLPGAEALMAVVYGAATQPGLLSQQYPPPLLPKPGKDNARLQKLLKRTAKKKASTQASQPAVLFRSSLSPVNEASPDLEHSDHSTPPKTPETSFSLYNTQQPPRFSVRPLYRHVASPYPQRAAHGSAARFSPQTVANALYTYSQNVNTVSSSAHLYGVSTAPGPVAELAVPKISVPVSSVPEATAPAAEVKKPAFSTFAETPAGFRPSAAGGTPQTKSPGPTPYPATEGQALTRPLIVLTPLVKSKSPRPTFKATEPSRSPKPMFDVPQIRMYTASTSYYESSRTPPVYDTAGLTAIGSTVPQSKTATETKQDLTPASEVRRGTTPTTLAPLLGTDSQRKTPTSEIKRATPTAEIKRATPTSEIKRATPTAEIKRATPTSEIKRATPTSEIRVKTPTFELQTLRTSVRRPTTPSYHKNRATTPVFEVSRPNPLLFAVSPITVEPEKSSMPKTVSAVSSLPASPSVKTIEPEPKPTETILNGEIHSDVTSVVKPIPKTITKSKSEPDLTRQTAPAGSQRPIAAASEPKTPAVTSFSNQRPKTPTYEASRLMTTSPGFKRPKTPTYGTSPSGVSSIAFQRPKTPTQVALKSKSSYRGLTPAEYTAYGGIRTYSPAFGISSSTTQTDEIKATKEESPECKTPSQEQSVKGQFTPEVSKAKETPKDVEKVAATPSIPIIVVTQASDTSGTTLTQQTSTVSSQVTQETPKAKPPTTAGKTPEKQKVQTQAAKPKTKPPEAKHPLPKSDNQDPLKAVRKLLGKDKVQKSGTETKAGVSDQKEPVKPVAATKSNSEGPTPSTAAPALPSAAESTGSEDKGKDKKAESAPAVKSAPEKKEGDESLLAEPLLKVMQRPKGVKSKLSGWSRLKKHMVVEEEEPKFPEIGPQKEAAGPKQSEATTTEGKAVDAPGTQQDNQTNDAPIAAKMWNAVLFQMFSTKENIMHQIELNKSEDEKKEAQSDEQKEIPSFAHRLPVLLFSPKFDAKKLKEAASRPVTKISTVFEMGLIGRKGKDEEPKDFNRTARGFAAT